jgi:general secretion pathway protein G
VQRLARIHGYSLIELLVVLALLGVLATAVMPLAELSVQRERERELKRSLWEIRDAIDSYKRAVEQGRIPAAPDGSSYPVSLRVLLDGVPDVQVPGQRHVFLRRIPRDPFADESVPAERSWRLRSYQSSAVRPQAGSDVYDVSSGSVLIGLNGVPLREW